MKQYIIYFIDYKNNDMVTLKASFTNKDLANDNLETQALQYITELQGKEQREICKQNKTAEELLADLTIKDGLYVKTVNDQIVVYKKFTETTLGWVKNTYETKCIKMGVFGLTELDLSDTPMSKCTNIPPPPSQKQKIVIKPQKPKSTSSSLDKNMNLVDELRTRQTSARMGLKRVEHVDKNTIPENKHTTYLDELLIKYKNNEIKLKHVTTIVKSIFDFDDIILTEEDEIFFEANQIMSEWKKSSGMPQEETFDWNISLCDINIDPIQEPIKWTFNPIYPDIDLSDMPPLEDDFEACELVDPYSEKTGS